MTKRRIFFIVLLIIFSVVSRLIFLADLPAGFTVDEAAQGYSAYSILKTAKDEWGEFLTINPRSFGEYKLPLYTYSILPSITIFGLDEFSVRLPSALVGTLAVIFTYLLVDELLNNSAMALMSSLLLVISPWHFSLSRGAFEANLTTCLLPAAFWFFLKGLKQSKFLLLSSLMFGLNLFSYHSGRMLTPIFLAFFLWWKRKEFFRLVRKKKSDVLISGLIFGLFLAGVGVSLLRGGGSRASDIGIFSAGWEAPRLFINSYLSYLSWEFFFTRGAGEASYGMMPGRGILYLIELPFLITAFSLLAKKWNRNMLPILFWILIAPLPAGLTRGVGYHANRVAIMMPAIQILSAYGLANLVIRQGQFKKVIGMFLGFLLFVSAVSFFWSYFRSSAKITAPAMSYGWRQAMALIKQRENGYSKVIISRKFSEPQIFVAFYKQWNPTDFQKESQDWLRYEEKGFKFVDQLGEYGLGKYEFRAIDWSEDRNLKNVLFVGKEVDFPQDENLVKRIIPYPDGQPAFLIVERR